MSDIGDKETPPQRLINTQGGAAVSGNIDTGGGKFVGRDEVTNLFTGDVAYDVAGLPNPYLGLAAFTYADRAKYGGREHDVASGVARLTTPAAPQSLLFVTGASGSGKSSFAQAGLLPALEAHYAGLVVRWAVFRPSRDPVAGLRDALWRGLGLPAPTDADLTPQAFAEFLSQHTPGRQVNVLVIDQFEELFTQAEPAERDALISLLSDLPAFDQARIHVIATLRSDYLPDLFRVPALFELHKQSGVELRAMREEELRIAIQKPLQATYPPGAQGAPDSGKRFDPALVDQLARDAGEDAAYLPLLQVTLEDIWDRGKLVRGAYSNLGDALEERANKVLDYVDFPLCRQSRGAAERSAVLGIFADLVEVSADDDPKRDVRKRRTRAELEAGSPDRRQLIDALAAARLLSVTAAAPDDGPAWVDVIHESLLREWDALRTTVADRRQVLRRRTRFEGRLRDWQSNSRSDSYLLDGVFLAEARELERAGDVSTQSPDARELLRLSIERAEQEQQAQLAQANALVRAEQRRARLARATTAIVSALLVIALAAFGFGLIRQQEAERASAAAQAESARAIRGEATAAAAKSTAEAERQIADEQARLARSRQWATVARAELDRGNAETAMRVAVRANQEARTFESEDVLRQALLATDFALVREFGGGLFDFVRYVQFAPDGRHMLSHGGDGEPLWWDIAANANVSLPVFARCARLSPDGTRVAVSNFADIHVIDIASREIIASMPHGMTNDDPNCNVDRDSLRFSSNGRFLAAASSYSQTLKVWDALTYRPVMTLEQDGRGPDSFEFSPDEIAILTVQRGQAVRWTVGTGISTTLNAADGQRDQIRRARYSPDGRLIAVTGGDLVSIQDATTGQLAQTPISTTDVVDAFFSPDATVLVTRDSSGAYTAWAAQTGQALASFDGYGAHFSPDGRMIAVRAEDGIRVINPFTGRVIATLSGSSAGAESPQFSPDGRAIVTVNNRGAARLWAYGGDEQAIGHTGAIVRASFSRDGKRLATASADGTARLWDAATLRELKVLASPGGSADIDAAGDSVITLDSNGGVHLWSIATGLESRTLPRRNMLAAGFAPDGASVATLSDDGTIQIWGVDGNAGPQTVGQLGRGTGRPDEGERFDVPAPADERGIDVWFSADGRSVTTESAGIIRPGTRGERQVRLVRTWDAASGDEIERREVPDEAANGARGISRPKPMARSGDLAAMPGDDGTARLVMEAGDRVWAILRGHSGPVADVQFSPDGAYALTASEDGTARRHLVRLEDLLRLAASRVPGALTCEERVRLLQTEERCS